MSLTVENVLNVLDYCRSEVKSENDMKVEGVVLTEYLNTECLKEKAENINQMLSELPETLKEGLSFLQLCNTKEGRQWTSLHINMDALVILGIAIGKFKFMFPRNVWSTLPGGMPYITITE